MGGAAFIGRIGSLAVALGLGGAALTRNTADVGRRFPRQRSRDDLGNEIRCDVGEATRAQRCFPAGQAAGSDARRPADTRITTGRRPNLEVGASCPCQRPANDRHAAAPNSGCDHRLRPRIDGWRQRLPPSRRRPATPRRRLPSRLGCCKAQSSSLLRAATSPWSPRPRMSAWRGHSHRSLGSPGGGNPGQPGRLPAGWATAAVIRRQHEGRPGVIGRPGVGVRQLHQRIDPGPMGRRGAARQRQRHLQSGPPLSYRSQRAEPGRQDHLASQNGRGLNRTCSPTCPTRRR